MRMKIGARLFDGPGPFLMGILNTTPDSFSDGGRFFDPGAAAERALAMVLDGAVVSVSGRRLATPVGSICVHGDGAHAVAAAKRLKARLLAAGVAVAPFASA